MGLSEIRKAPFFYLDFGGEMVRDPILTTKSWGRGKLFGFLSRVGVNIPVWIESAILWH